jgi:hypothetical protein
MKYAVLLLGLITGLSTVAIAAPRATPMPGGSNQAMGVEGTIGSKLFNGEVRLQPTQLRDANAADGMAASDGQHWLVFTATASNGTHKALDMQQFNASIADAGGNTIQAQPDKVRPIGGVFGVPPGGAWKEQVFFEVPNDFKPVKILLQPYNGKHQVFRITIRPTDYQSQ